MEKKSKYTKYIDIAFAVFFVSVTALFIWKAPYGFHFFDEANWIALSDRLLKGDALLYDDWTLTQITLVILYPLVKLYHVFFAGNEGIILAFRYIFVFFHALNTVLLYLLIRRRSPLAALGAVMLYFPYSHLYIEALSYYTMALDFLLLGCAMLVTAKHEKRELFFSGVLLALAVLECPYFAVMYIAYFIACLVCAVRKKEVHDLLRWRSFGRITAGCAVPVLILVLFVLSRVSAGELIRTLPYLLRDEAHSVGGHGGKLAEFIKDTVKSIDLAEILLFLPVILCAFDRKRKKLCTSALLALTLGAIGKNFLSSRGQGMALLSQKLMLPLSLAGLGAYAMCEKKDRELLFGLYIPGWVMGACLYLASDVGYSVVSTPLTVCACAGGWFLLELTEECMADARPAPKRCMAALLAAVLLFQTGYELWYRKNFCFSEPAGPALMYCDIRYGIGKGEKTTEKVAVYEQDGLWAATEKVRNAPGEYVLYFSDDCWPYLEDSKKCASFAIWIQTGHAEAEAKRLLDYWKKFPEKRPDAIYVSKKADKVEKILETVNTENFPVEENERGYEMVRPQ